jgi:hypothetical protein
MKDVGIFYGHLVHFTVFSYILWTFVIVRGNLVYFPFLVFYTKKNLATLISTLVICKGQCVGGSNQDWKVSQIYASSLAKKELLFSFIYAKTQTVVMANGGFSVEAGSVGKKRVGLPNT